LNASNDAADRTTIAMQQPVLLRDGDVLSIAPPTSGLRDYVAVRGGFGVATTLGSAATDTMSGIGPRPIAAKQRLAIRTASTACDAGVGLPQPWPTDLPKPGRPTDLYVRLGPRDDWFTSAGLSAFLTQTWTVTAQSNRVGLRLSGATGGTHRHARTGQRGHAIRRNRSADQRTTGHFSARPACNRRISGNRRA